MKATIVLAVTGMHCNSCGLLVDDAVEQVPGVLRSRTDQRRERTTVELDPALASVDAVVAAILAEGYGATVATG